MRILSTLVVAVLLALSIHVPGASAAGLDATMSTSAGGVTISGFSSTYGSVSVKLYNGGWGLIGSAWDNDGVVRLVLSCPSSSQRAYWVVVTAPGYSKHTELFYRNYRC